jgi:hypothetical protein
MPGFHSKKEKRQAKHIIAGYKKRGVPMKKAKSIAWATVNKERSEQTEAWQFNGAGQPVFMGNAGNVSQFDPSGQVSPGSSYIPDEVAKMLVKESGLRKNDTCPKRVIIGYLESMGLSAALAVDVAMVLRNVYGITPTFDESTLYARSGSLIEELTGVVSESYPMPFAIEVEDETEELNEVNLIGSFLQSELMESKDEEYDLVLAHMATLTPQEFCDVVDFHEWVGTEVFNYIELIAVDGPNGAAESVVEGLCWPQRIQFMPEHIQDLFDEDAADDVIKKGTVRTRSKLPVTAKVSVPGKIPRRPGKDPKRVPQAVPSFRKQMAKHGQDLPSDPLAAKKPGAALAAHQARKAAASAPSPSPSKMKRAGGTAVGLMKKVGAAAKFVHTPSEHNPDVGPGLKKAGKAVAKVGGAIGKGILKGGVHAAGGLAGAAGHVGGSAIRGLARGLFGAKKKDAEHSGEHDSGEKAVARTSKPEKKPGLLSRAVGHIARAASGFAKHVAHHAKEGWKEATPGLRAMAGHGDGDKAEAPKKKERVATSGVGEATLRSGSLLSEMTMVLNGGPMPEESEDQDLVRSPAEVVAAFEATTVVDMAVLEAIGDLDWKDVAGVAGFMMMEPDKFQSLIQSFKESRAAFRAEWFRLEESGDKPSWMSIGSFVTLSKMTLDEGVVPRLVYWAARAVQDADEGVASYVAEAYPELGKTVYGPAGDPKEGPQITKSFMTPQPAGTMTPTDSECTTRMFSDPEEREKARKEKLADVMATIDGMRQQAAAAGVPPEGMFLNLYRDMHREKVRYS